MENARLNYLTKILEIAYDLTKNNISASKITPEDIKRTYDLLLSMFDPINGTPDTEIVSGDSVPNTDSFTNNTGGFKTYKLELNKPDNISMEDYVDKIMNVLENGGTESDLRDIVVNDNSINGDKPVETKDVDYELVETQNNCNCIVCEERNIKSKQMGATPQICEGDINDDMEGEDPDDFLRFDMDDLDEEDDDDDE